jgi:putative ABC transport system permease protein
MLGLTLATMWRRRTQTALLFLLASVAAAGAATAPGYVVASEQSLAVAAAADATVADRVVEAQADREISTDLTGRLSEFATRVRDAVGLPAATIISGATTVAVLDGELHTLAYRDDACVHLAIEGSCPQAAGELLIAVDLAAKQGLRVGDRIGIRGRNEIPPVAMTVVGRYRPLNPADAYWGRQADTTDRLAEVGIFTPPGTFGLLGPNHAGLSVDLVVAAEAYRDADPWTLADSVQDAGRRLTTDGITVSSGLPVIAQRVADEQQLVVTGAVIGVGELLIVTWLALFLAIRRTADGRRGDLGLLKLRGTRRRDLWRLVAGLTLVPLGLGGVVGAALGPWLAGRLAGPVTPDPARPPLWTMAAAAAALAVLGAALVAFAAERRWISAPLTSLNRQVGPAHPGRAALVLDAMVVLLAVAGAYQSTTDGPQSQGIGLLAPLLLALAVGVLTARLVPLAAGRIGRRTLRVGRLGAGLAALHLARRPGTAPVLGLIVVVVATLVTTALAWSVAATSYEQRATAEVGAPRVLTVRASTPGQLLTAVRAADPDGRFAMAVVRTDAAAGTVLAVDTTRLAAVAPNLTGYGFGNWDSATAQLRPAGFDPVVLHGSSITVDATWTPVGHPTGAVALAVRVVTADGMSDAPLGPLRPGRYSYTAAVPGCAAGCRLVALTLSSTVDRPPNGSALLVRAMSGGADEKNVLADRGQWRASVTVGAQVPEIAAGPDGLSISLDRGVPAEATALAVTVYVVDSPTPLPVLRAGDLRLNRADPRIAVLGSDVLPVRLAGQGRSLPEIGAGLLVDLEYADRLSSGSQRPTMQVWLTGSTPAGVTADLAAAGVTVLSEASIDGRRSQLQSRGSAAALRFMLVIALVAVGLALLTFAVATAAELRPRGIELAALRRQGLPPAVARRVGYLGYLAFAVLAVGLGLLTGLALRLATPSAVPIFADHWSTLDPPTAPPTLVAALAVTTFATFATVAGLGGAALVRAARAMSREQPWSD